MAYNKVALITGMKMMRMRRMHRGIGLIEIAMGLGIAALIIAAALSYFGNANMGRQVNDAMAQLGGVQQVVRSLTSGQSDYTGIDSPTVAQSHQLPNKYNVGNPATGLTSAFQGPVVVVSSNNNQNFDVAMTNVPRDACSRLATADMGTGMLAVGVGANDPTGGTGIAAMSGRVTSNPSQAYTAPGANAACATALNVIAWRFN